MRQKVSKPPHIPPTLDERGHEVLDATPAAIPVRFKGNKPGLTDEVARAMMYLSMEASANEQESFEEADDFTIPGDNDFFSPHEIDEEQEAYDAARDERWLDGNETTPGSGAAEPKTEHGSGRPTPAPGGTGPGASQPTPTPALDGPSST